MMLDVVSVRFCPSDDCFLCRTVTMCQLLVFTRLLPLSKCSQLSSNCPLSNAVSCRTFFLIRTVIFVQSSSGQLLDVIRIFIFVKV